MAPASSRPRRDVVRGAVIAAAAELFTRQGYGATTLDQVATAAGFTKGAVYSNFEGKPELFAATVAGRFRSRAGDAVDAAARLGTDPGDELARQLADIAVSEVWALQQAEFALLARTDAGVAAVYADIRRDQVNDLWTRLRDHVVELGIAPDVDLEATAVLLLTTINGLATEHQLAPDLMPAARIERVFAQLLEGLSLRGVR